MNNSNIDIKYASVLPGTGKTHWALKKLSAHLENKKNLIFYVAPTNKLLDEVYNVLVKRNPDLESHIRLVRTDRGSANKVSVGKQLELLLIGGVDPLGNTYTPLTFGVILCTHEGFTRINHDSSNSAIAKRRRSATVIFDEARKCTVDTRTFTLPDWITDELFQKYLQFTEEPLRNVTPGVAAENLSEYKKLQVLSGDTKHLSNLFSKNKKLRMAYTHLTSLLETSANSATQLYASLSVQSVKKSKTSDSETSTCQTVIHTLLVPYKLFHGWGEVTLLSAFFENSQMFHLLKQHDVTPYEKPVGKNETAAQKLKRMHRILQIPTPLRLINVTDEVVNPKRVQAVRRRFALTSIAYISPDTSFSKRHLDQGVMIDHSGRDAFNFFVEEHRAAFGRNSLQTIVKLMHNKDTFTPSAGVQQLIKALDTLPGLVTKYTPLQWYARAAVYISQEWYKRKIAEGVVGAALALPITCNAGSNEEYLKDMGRALPANKWVRMPFQSHGLNTFLHYDTIAFLATLNPKPEVRKIMNQLCPSYNPDLDYTLDQCIQTSARCSLRDTKSTSHPLIIVTDEKLALSVREHLCGLPTIVHPEDFGIPLKIPVALPLSGTRSQESKLRKAKYNLREDVKEKANLRIKKLRSSPEYKAREAYIKENSKYAKRVASLVVMYARYKKSDDERGMKRVKPELDDLRVKLKAEKPTLLKKYADLKRQQSK